MSDIRRVRVIVHGLVQGVGFRAWTQRQAGTHGLDGWVRNWRDATVEAVFAGPGAAVAAMLTACERGPRGSRVERVEVSEAGEDAPVPGRGFSVRPTA